MAAPALAAPALTVVVPTRDRPALVARCLGALAVQRLDGELEIVVVDDHTRDADALARTVAATPGARIVPVEGNGLSAARNTGVRAARSPFVCFTDDDCEPEPHWAARLQDRLRTGAAVVAGITVNGNPRCALAAASQIAANAFVAGARDSMPPASNFACRRDVALAIRFDESYAGIGAEDRDWYARVATAGHDLLLEPRAVVRHLPSVTVRDFVGRHVRYGRGAHRFRRQHRDGRLEPPAFYAELIRRGFHEGVVPGLGVCLAQAATAVGFLLEARAQGRRPAARRASTRSIP